MPMPIFQDASPDLSRSLSIRERDGMLALAVGPRHSVVTLEGMIPAVPAQEFVLDMAAARALVWTLGDWIKEQEKR